MRPLRRALSAPRARVYPALATFVVTLIATGTLTAAGLTDGFARDLLLNVGASLALVPPTYLVFAPIFERLRQTAAPIQEHTRLDRARLTDGIRGSRWMVEMMATFSSVLEEPYRGNSSRHFTEHCATARQSASCCWTQPQSPSSSAPGSWTDWTSTS
jgi:hypothetical protein